MNNYHKNILLNLLIYACLQSTVSASESDWNLYTSKDELTGKTSKPYLIYKSQIPGNSKGIIQIKINCFNMEAITDSLMSELLINNAPILEVTQRYDGNYNSSRILTADGSVITRFLLQDKKYRNVFYGELSLSDIKSNLPKKQEFIFDGGINKMQVEFGQKYSNYVKSCLLSQQQKRKRLIQEEAAAIKQQALERILEKDRYLQSQGGAGDAEKRGRTRREE